MKKVEKTIYDNFAKLFPCIIICSFLAVAVSLLLGLSSIRNAKDCILHYTDSSTLNYNVFLKPNSFYTLPSLPKDRQYVSTLIDYIDSDFSYNFTLDENIALAYKYRVVANLLIDSTDGKNIFSKEEVVIPETDLTGVLNNRFSIGENVKINYDQYNSVATEFIKQYDIPAKARLVVSMYVDVVGKSKTFEKDLNDSSVISLEIPLTTKMTDIKLNYDLSNNTNKTFVYASTAIERPVVFGLAIVLLLLAISWSVVAFIEYFSRMDTTTKYKRNLKKIFRNYGQFISQKAISINTRDIMYTQSLRVEIVQTFDDLINVRDNVEKPILFYESVPDKQAVFYVIDTKVTYIYVLSASDFNKEKKEKGLKDGPTIERIENTQQPLLEKTAKDEAKEEEKIKENEQVEEEIEPKESKEVEKEETEKKDKKISTSKTSSKKKSSRQTSKIDVKSEITSKEKKTETKSETNIKEKETKPRVKKTSSKQENKEVKLKESKSVAV